MFKTELFVSKLTLYCIWIVNRCTTGFFAVLLYSDKSLRQQDLRKQANFIHASIVVS